MHPSDCDEQHKTYSSRSAREPVLNSPGDRIRHYGRQSCKSEEGNVPVELAAVIYQEDHRQKTQKYICQKKDPSILTFVKHPHKCGDGHDYPCAPSQFHG